MLIIFILSLVEKCLIEKEKEKERRELEKCKSDKKQKVLGDFFNQFESSPITIPDASQNVDKKKFINYS